MFEYNICTQADETIYRKQCVALEKYIPGLRKGDELTDVDTSKFQEYFFDGKKLIVCNSVYIDAVFIKSEFDLDQFF